MFQRYADIVGALLTVMGPLVAVPLTVMTFYLRGLKEQLHGAQADLGRRMEALEQATGELRREWRIAERDFAGKEEWLREVLQTRRQVQRIARNTSRIRLELRAGRHAARAEERESATQGEEVDRGGRAECA